MADAEKRRKLIRELVSGRSISTQVELVKRLREQGISCTQASISRDIVALGLIKKGGRYSLPNMQVVVSGLSEQTAKRIHRVQTAGDNLIVLHTNPGEANIVALSLDAARWPSVAGTIAGDDTVFVACGSGAAQKQALAALRELVQAPFF